MSYNYFIYVFNTNFKFTHNHGDYVEERYIEGDGIPLCCDFSVAIPFVTTDAAHKFAIEECKLKYGEYAIHGFYC